MKSHNRNKRREGGQSLVEFVILVPLFFIVCSGINLYLNQEIKSLTEDSAQEALLIADSHFDFEERTLAKWSALRLQTSPYNTDILKNSFNASAYFGKSVDQKDGVFLDKKNVQNGSEKTCATNPVYALNLSASGQFKFTSCADGSGFERAKFSYQNIQEDFKTTTRTQEGKSIYYPNENFSWQKRHLMAAEAVKKFKINPQEQSFRRLYASLALPADQAQFNAKCLMNPKEPECSLPTLTGKWRRAVFDGANTQVLECLAEASAKCLKAVAPPAIAGCVVERTAEIAAALAAGKKAPVCPILNRIAETIYNEVLFTAKAYQIKTLMYESTQRINFF